MQEANQWSSVTGADLLCKYDQKAKMLCCEENCQKYACVCRNDDCKCLPEDHNECQFVYADGLVNRIKKKKSKLTQEIQNAIEAIDKIYVDAIDKLSKDRQALASWKNNFGLTAAQVQFLQLIAENKLNQINGSLVHKIKKGSNHLVDNSLLTDKWVDNFWKEERANFKRIFSKLSKFFKEFVSVEKITKSPYIDSKIVQESDILVEFLGRPIIEFRLLYRASENKFSTKSFHQKCDNIPNTLILLETSYKKIVGGYTPLSWRTLSGRQILPDPSLSTFLFSVTMNEKYQIMNQQQAIQNYESVGPRFGGTDNLHGDLQIVDQANQKDGSYFNFPTSYNLNNKPRDNKSKLDFCGKESGTGVTLNEWEVFEVVFGD